MTSKTKSISRVMSSVGSAIGRIIRVDASEENAAIARGVLGLVGLGICKGAGTLQRHYRHTKVNEFVDVSGEILAALKKGYENNFPKGSVTMCMRVNHKLKQFELIQLGGEVTLRMDKYETKLGNTTLTKLYATMREDILLFPDVYGQDLQITARSYPDPNNVDGQSSLQR